MRRVLVLTVTALAALTAAAGEAMATDRCVQAGAAPAVPCPGSYAGVTYQTVNAAKNAVANGDTVRIMPGTYLEPVGVAFGNKTGVTFYGHPGAAAPLITSNAANDGYTFLVGQGAAGTTLRHLRIAQQNVSAYALKTGQVGQPNASDVTLEDVSLEGSGYCGSFLVPVTATDLKLSVTNAAWCLQINATTTIRNINATANGAGALLNTNSPITIDGGTITGSNTQTLLQGRTMTLRHLRLIGGIRTVLALEGTTIEDSLVTNSADNGVGIDVSSGASSVRNVTVAATGAGSTAIRAAVEAMSVPSGTATVVNTIARGVAKDLLAQPGGPTGCGAAGTMACAAGKLSVHHSNFRPGSSSGLTDAGANQDADPMLNALDFRPFAGSPVIDAGAAVPAGTTDLAGTPRPKGAAPDLGAFETDYPPTAAPGTSDPGPSTPVPGTQPGPTTPAVTAKCVVPKLRGKSLRAARKALKAARCTLGKVTRTKRAKRKRLSRLVVRVQKPLAGRTLAQNAKVAVRLDLKPRARRPG